MGPRLPFTSWVFPSYIAQLINRQFCSFAALYCNVNVKCCGKTFCTTIALSSGVGGKRARATIGSQLPIHPSLSISTHLFHHLSKIVCIGGWTEQKTRCCNAVCVQQSELPTSAVYIWAPPPPLLLLLRPDAASPPHLPSSPQQCGSGRLPHRCPTGPTTDCSSFRSISPSLVVILRQGVVFVPSLAFPTLCSSLWAAKSAPVWLNIETAVLQVSTKYQQNIITM